MITVLNGVLSACNTWLFAFQKAVFHIIKGSLLRTCQKHTETVSKSYRNMTDCKYLPQGGSNNSTNGLIVHVQILHIPRIRIETVLQKSVVHFFCT